MKCTICQTEGKWKNVDKYRIKPQGMEMCTSCGFVSYPSRYKSKDKVIDYYRKEYRATPPKVHNLYTGQNKLHYHNQFLMPLLKQWIKEGKKDPVVSDVGAAFGLLLAWLRDIKDQSNGAPAFPKIDLNGVELTLTFRRVAYHEFGLNLKEEFDASKKYDLISSYKVAEHMFDVRDELIKYRECLKEGGHLYISVPTWFERMTNFGIGGFDLEYYYHPDHCNVWTKEHFQRLLAETGFKIIKQDHLMYDSTYLCVVGEEDVKQVVPGPLEIEGRLDLIYKANELLSKRKFIEAIQTWPNFPVGRRAVYEHNRNTYHQNGWGWIKQNIIEEWLKIDPEFPEALLFAADLALRYDRYDDALDYIKRGLVVRNDDTQFLTLLANMYRTMASKEPDANKRYQNIASARQVTQVIKNTSLQSHGNAVTWIYNDHAQLPMPGE